MENKHILQKKMCLNNEICIIFENSIIIIIIFIEILTI